MAGSFLLTGQSVIKTLKNVYARWQRIRQSLLMLDREIFGESIEDIEDQLEDLHLADFVYRMDYSHWQQYPRYLEALEIRIDRLEHNIESDLDGVYALDLHMERPQVAPTMSLSASTAGWSRNIVFSCLPSR